MTNGMNTSQKNIEKKLAKFSNDNNIYPLEVPKFTPLKDTPLPDNVYKLIVKSHELLLEEMKKKALEEKKRNKYASFTYTYAQELYTELSQYDEIRLKNIFISAQFS